MQVLVQPPRMRMHPSAVDRPDVDERGGKRRGAGGGLLAQLRQGAFGDRVMQVGGRRP